MVVIAPAADGVPPRVEEIIVLLFLAPLKRRAAEEKKARVVIFFVSKDDDDAFVGDVKVSAGDGADERRSPTALCIALLILSLKTACAFFCIEISCEKGQQFPTKKIITFHTLSLL
jgi:hypothetical protein